MTDPVKPDLLDPFLTRFSYRMLTWMMTSSLTRSLTRLGCLIRLGQRPDPDVDPTRSTTRPECLTRPGQRPDPVNADPVNSPAACAMRFHMRRAFWWRIRARVRLFLGDLDIYVLVLKFSTVWYIYFACLKLLQI